MVRFIGVFLCLMVAAGLSDAQCRHVFRNQVIVGNAAAVVATQAVIAPVAVPVVVPAYGASYTPPCDTEALVKGLKAVEDRLAAVEQRLSQQVPAPPPAQAPPVPNPNLPDPFNPPPVRTGKAQPATPQAGAPGNAVAILAAKCSQCHDASKADAAGGGFAFLKDGQALKLDARGLLRVVARSYAGTMPPKKSGIAPLSDEEVAAVLGFIGTQKEAR